MIVDLAETAGPRGLAGAWSSSDTIVYPGPNGLAAIAASGGGASRPLMTPEQIAAHGGALFPEFLPGGDMLLVSSISGDGTEDRSIDLLTLATGERRVLVQGGVLPRYCAGEEDRPATHVNIIFNWFEELKRLVPTQLQKPS